MTMNRSYVWPGLSIAVALVVLTIALPQNWKGWVPSLLRAPRLHFGLDLAGGTQLDFRISEQEMEEQFEALEKQIAALEAQGGASADQIAALRAQQQSVEELRQNIVEAIRVALERRINALGVSEAQITPSYFGGEKHLLVECPGVVDTQQCIAIVGKTIQLEFKEEYTSAPDVFKKEVRENVADTLARITKSGANLALLGQDLGDELGVLYIDRALYFKGQLPKGLEVLWNGKPSKDPRKAVTKHEGSIAVEAPEGEGKTEELEGIFLAEVLEPRFQTGRTITEAPTAFGILDNIEENVSYKTHSGQVLDASIETPVVSTLRLMQPGDLESTTLPDGTARVLFLRSLTKGREEVEASHILVSYKGASGADPSITRTKEQALARAKELKARLDRGENFAALARRESDGPSKAQGGSLGKFTRGMMVPAFEEVAFTLPPGVMSDPVETPFGYHLIRVDRAPVISLDRASYDELIITGNEANIRAADEFITRLQAGMLRRDEDAIALRLLFFSLKPTGWNDTPLDGKHFHSASVTLDPITNIPVVQIQFDEEGGKLFQELTKRNVQKRLAIFVGGELVSAPVVQEEISGGTAVITGSRNFEEARRLAQDLNTGAIPAPIHLVGQYTVEATLGAKALRTSLQAALLGTVILMLYMVAVYRLLGIVACIALVVYGILLFTILKLPLFLLSKDYIVLTLAGMAGIILSLGMAIDANVLVFERMKEELRKGKLVKTAVETSFRHAWPAIRDGNVSTLITCAILFMVGTSIVRGFAITLGMGVILSMFTAITITRWMLRRIAHHPLAENLALFGVHRNA